MIIKLINLDNIADGEHTQGLQDYDAIVVRGISQSRKVVFVDNDKFKGRIQRTKSGEKYAICWRKLE